MVETAILSVNSFLLLLGVDIEEGTVGIRFDGSYSYFCLLYFVFCLFVLVEFEGLRSFSPWKLCVTEKNGRMWGCFDLFSSVL